MNQAEIATVERLRREGKGLSAIAQETGISINTIKSHCSRHGLSGSRPIRTCMFCNTEIKTADHFCSDTCRAGWYEIHSSDEQDILRLCKTCRQPKQVYCSKQCFYTDRYHSQKGTTEYEINREVLQSILPETAAALVKMTMDYLMSSGWSPPEDGNTTSLSAVVDAIYKQNSFISRGALPFTG